MEGHTFDVAEGQRGNSSIYHAGDGFYYHVREERGNRLRLKCRNYGRGCKGTGVVFLNHNVLEHRKPHNHEPDMLFLQDKAMRREIITEASQSTAGRSSGDILIQAKMRCQNPELAARFTSARMRGAIDRARYTNLPPIPATLLFLGVLLGVPDMHPICRTVDGTDYIFKGCTGNQRERSVCVVFASGRMLQFLQTRRTLHGDGTFKKRPKKPKCAQIFNVVTKFGDNVVALLRCFMQSRKKVAYLALFNFLKALAPNLAPLRYHCDFERSQINAFRAVFGRNCFIAGCLWHFAVAVSRKARSLGLARLTKENVVVLSFIRCICGAPLLPRNLIVPGIEEIRLEVEASGWGDTLRPLFDYFFREWVPRTDELSVYGFPERTNNCSESDNRCLASVIRGNYPNVWQCIAGFGQLEHLAWCDKLAIEMNRSVNGPRRWSVVANDARIQRATHRLGVGDLSPGQFLHASSWAIFGAVNHGLQLNDSDNESDSDSDSDSDSEGVISDDSAMENDSD